MKGLVAVLILALLSPGLPSHSAYAAYDRTTTWADMSELDLKGVLRSHYASPSNLYNPIVSDSMLEVALSDADQRISKDFHIPASEKASVKFWLRIYAQYSTQQVVLFDSNHMDLVYEVVDFRGIAETSRNAIVYEILSKRMVDKALARYREAFAKLEKHPRPAHPSPTEKVILTQMKKIKHRHSFRELAQNLKVMRGQRDNIIKGLLAAEAFFPQMEKIFARLNIPSEIARLCLVESSFNLNARSKVGASGIWQFMPAIAKKYLLMDSKFNVDERLSPLKSTLAAGKLLLWNYQHLGSWPLAIICYNHGLKALPKFKKGAFRFSKIAYLFESCKGQKPLGWASRNYYSEFLAVVYAESYRNLFYGETPQSFTKSIAFEQLNQKQTGLAFAMEKGISLQEFRLFNADVEDLNKPLPKGFWLAVPGEREDVTPLVDYSLSAKLHKSLAPKSSAQKSSGTHKKAHTHRS